MARSEKGLELKVGIFVFVGLAVLGALVVEFGRFGEGWKHYYTITVEFPDASGLLKGSDVLLAGAKIGFVSGGPRLVPNGRGVQVPLKIYEFVKIPVGSRITVGASGLLGDRFVNVSIPAGQPTSYFSPNAVIAGTRETGLDDLTKQGSALVGDLRTTVQNVNTAVTRLNEQAFSPESMQNLKQSIAHLNEMTSSLAESSKKIDGVVEKADGAVASTKQAADDLQAAIADARKTIAAATNVMRQATQGPGLLPTMLSNQDLANDLRALVSNLRAHGVLFYRDSAAKIDAREPSRKPSR